MFVLHTSLNLFEKVATIRCDDGYLFVGNPVALTTPAPTTTTTTTSTTTPPTCCKLKLKDKSLTFFQSILEV